MWLSKSDFKIARSCPTKLYYRKLQFPSLQDKDPYLRFLAEGGYMIGKLATLYYPEGIEIETNGDHEAVLALTAQYLQQENVTLFEAAIASNGKLIRIDILEKKGNHFNLIEVKSKAWDSREPASKQKAKKKDLVPYLEDAAFQYLTLQEAFPEATITTYLMLPDKGKKTNIEGLNQQFQLQFLGQLGSFKRYEVNVLPQYIPQMLEERLLILVDIQKEVQKLLPDVKTMAAEMVASLSPTPTKIASPLAKKCFACEFCLQDDRHPQSGFGLCWADMPQPQYPIQDLYYIGAITHAGNLLVDQLIAEKKVDLQDFDQDWLAKPSKQSEGVRTKRQRIQIEHTLAQTEWIDPALQEVLDGWTYPLHFIDFENTAVALPFHKGMSPYMQVNFQWSCHTIPSPGAAPQHKSFLNLDPIFPNILFAESLMHCLGESGTLLMWSPYERTTLRKILEQNEVNDPILRQWLEKITQESQWVDMCDLAFKHYFHPMMKGKTSIKAVLPAVLSAFHSPKILDWLQNFEPNFSLLQYDQQEILMDPYWLLPPIELIDTFETVRDGTAAIRVYESMVFGAHRQDKNVKAAYAKALEKYCKLDTLAMVIIWEHWRTSLEKG